MTLKPSKAQMCVAALLAVLTAGTVAIAQQETPSSQPPKTLDQITFVFDRPGLEVPRFTLQVAEDGSARYEAEQIYPPPPGSDVAPAPLHVDRKLSVSRTTTAQIFTTARALNRFNLTCASSAKGIADTGTKTLHYSGASADFDGSCTYNYSQDKRVVLVTDIFQAIARTLDVGRKLDFNHRFDRLGLDAASASLVDEVEAGRAIELGTIAPTLKSIAQDSQVLERVRLRAARLLQQAQPSI